MRDGNDGLSVTPSGAVHRQERLEAIARRKKCAALRETIMILISAVAQSDVLASSRYYWTVEKEMGILPSDGTSIM